MNDRSIAVRTFQHAWQDQIQQDCIELKFSGAAQSLSPHAGQEIASARSNFTLQLAQDS